MTATGMTEAVSQDPSYAAGPAAGPTDFAEFWTARERAGVQRAERVFRRVARFELFPTDEQIEQLAAGYYDADPVAEAFVDEIYLARGAKVGRAMLDQALTHGIDSVEDAPESMRRLFAEFEEEPEWLDHAQVARGALLFRRFGPAVFSFAGVETLLAYTENSVVKPLALTGAYAGDTALHRFMETARFWIDVTDPDGLRAGGSGRATAMRVRIMHVFIRRRLMEHPDWDLEAWGVPISQSDALMTLMAGSFTPGMAMHALGYVNTPKDIEALMHFWRYVGHLMGVQPRWYPASVKEAVQMSAAYMLKRKFNAGQDGIELVESYPRAFVPKDGTSRRKRIRDEVHYRTQLGYTRLFLPGGFYRRYDMPNPWPWVVLPLTQVPFNLTVELLARVFPPVRRAQDRYARWRRATWWRNEMGDKDAQFAAVEQFRK